MPTATTAKEALRQMDKKIRHPRVPSHMDAYLRSPDRYLEVVRRTGESREEVVERLLELDRKDDEYALAYEEWANALPLLLRKLILASDTARESVQAVNWDLFSPEEITGSVEELAAWTEPLRRLADDLKDLVVAADRCVLRGLHFGNADAVEEVA